jgi:hypothetical protein
MVVENFSRPPIAPPYPADADRGKRPPAWIPSEKMMRSHGVKHFPQRKDRSSELMGKKRGYFVTLRHLVKK